jgi:ABC-2 type transport system permease protein
MSLPRILTLISRIVRQILHDRRTLGLIFIVPLVVMTILYLVLNSSSSVPTLAIVRPTGVGSDQVNKLLDTLLPSSDTLKHKNIQANQVDTTLNNGNADAVLIFPADFTQQLVNRQSPTVQIKLEGSDPTIASAMDKQVRGLVKQLDIALSVAQSQQGAPNVPQNVPQNITLPQNANSATTINIGTTQYLHGGPEYTYTDSLAPVFIGIFSFFFVFLLTSVAFLRERSQGTIERVMVSPLKRTELVMGYVCGFTLFALIQSSIILLFVVFVLRVHYSGNPALVFLVSALLTLGSVNLGIFLSTFAQNEFQIIQFIPLVFGVQVLLSGIFWPLSQLPDALRYVSYVLPLTYANEALRSVMLKSANIGAIANDLIGLLIFALIMVGLSSLTTRRQMG